MARILYKVVKLHELGDGNKRSAVISAYLFALVNDYIVTDAKVVKKQAKRIAATKGRLNENLIRKRVSKLLEGVVMYSET